MMRRRRGIALFNGIGRNGGATEISLTDCIDDDAPG
jgi:hypothetical protein